MFKSLYFLLLILSIVSLILLIKSEYILPTLQHQKLLKDKEMMKGKNMNPIQRALRDELILWSYDDRSFYDNCNLDSVCFGLPVGCEEFKECYIFVEITPPDIKDPSVGPEYKFRLFSVPSKFGVDVNHYVGVGLNKRHNRMVDSSLFACVFTHYRSIEVETYMYSWLEGYNVADITNDASQEIKYFTSYLDETEDGEPLLKCGFYRAPVTVIKIDTIKHPHLKNIKKEYLTFDLRRDTMHLLLATGHVKSYEKKNGKEIIKLAGHSPEERGSSARVRIHHTVCGRGVLCFGKGPDGCAKVAEDCPIFFRSSVKDHIQVFTLESKYQDGYVAIVLSDTEDIKKANSSIFFAQICQASPRPEVNSVTLDNCKWKNNANGKNEAQLTCDVKNAIPVPNEALNYYTGTLQRLPIIRKNMCYNEINAALDILEFDEIEEDPTKPIGPDQSALLKTTLSTNCKNPDVKLFCIFPLPYQKVNGVLKPLHFPESNHTFGDHEYYLYLFSGNNTFDDNKFTNGKISFTYSNITASSRKHTLLKNGKFADFSVGLNLESRTSKLYSKRQSGGDPSFDSVGHQICGCSPFLILVIMLLLLATITLHV